MLDAQKRQALEQALAELTEVFPSLWWQLYTGCREQGFSAEQAMDLVKTYIMSRGASESGEK